jgi:hypothetical protein
VKYVVQASVSKVNEDGWASVRHLPTFYLDSNVQGIIGSEHAKRIAREIVDPFYVLAVDLSVGEAS